MPASVHLQAEDLRKLSFGDNTFELVVCFEVIERMQNPSGVLDELVGVLAPGGLLLISSPRHSLYRAGNPHHIHEFTPSELEEVLSARLANVRLVRQSNYIVSALLGDASYAQGDGNPIDDIGIRKLTTGTPGEETYTIAISSDSPLPELRQLGAMTGTLEFREWLAGEIREPDRLDHR